MAEAAYLIGRRISAEAEARFFRSIANGDLIIDALTGDGLVRIADLVDTYSDLPLSPVEGHRSSIDLLPSIDVPSVVVAGSGDFVCSPPKNLRIHHAILGSKFVLVENAGHFPWFENPDQFWAGLHSALDALDA